MLRTAQRRMLRWMLRSHWKNVESSSSSDDSSERSETTDEETEENEHNTEEESFVDWIQRCTHVVEEQLAFCKIDDWVVAQRKRKWRLAGHSARRTDGRWSEAVLGWIPQGGSRSRGHPERRWLDSLNNFFLEKGGLPKGLWQNAAQDRKTWHDLEEDFVQEAWSRC